MAHDLYEREAGFRACVEDCFDLLEPQLSDALRGAYISRRTPVIKSSNTQESSYNRRSSRSSHCL